MASSDVAVETRQACGRGLFAARDLPAGHVVLVDLPALVVPAPDAAHAVCASCLKRLEDPRKHLKCPGCCSGVGVGSGGVGVSASVRFCSPECLASRAGAPGFHTPALCRALQEVDYRGLPDADAASSLRFVLTAAMLRAEAEAGGKEAAAAFGAIASMTAPETSVARLGERELALRARRALEIAGIGIKRLPTPREVGEWLAVEEANGFAALSSPSSVAQGGAAPAPAPPPASPASLAAPDYLPRVRGTCFYPRAFLFNHDCLPSVARFDDFDGEGHGAALEAAIARAAAAAVPPAGSEEVSPVFSSGAEFLRHATPAQRRTALVAATLHPLPRGEELRLSYVPISWGAAERAGRLAACYGFCCRCARCLGELEVFGGGGERGGRPSSLLDEETAAAISAAASWARCPSVSQEEARAVLASALRLASDAARRRFPETQQPAAEIGYIRAFVAKFSCPAPRKGGDEEGDEGEEEEECGGTLVPVASHYYQCNSCGFVRSEEEFLRSLAALNDDEDDGSEYDDDEEGMEDD